MFERFTDRARRVLVLAQEQARERNHNFLGTEHILLGLLAEGEGVAAKALTALGVRSEAVVQRIDEIIGPAAYPTVVGGAPPFTPRSKKVLELSLREALDLRHNYIGTEHLLLGLVREGEGVAAQVLAGQVGDLARVRNRVLEMLEGYKEGSAPAEVSEQRGQAGVSFESGYEVASAADEIARLTEENERLRALLADHGIDPGDGGDDLAEG